jgi:hypothetical protein
MNAANYSRGQRGMKLSSFVDFYLLEALLVAKDGDNAPLLHSHAKLAADIAYEYQRVSSNMASMLNDYLWLAALGETRWAHRSATFYTESLPQIGSRKSAYSSFRKYPPVEHNIQVLEKIFFDRWYTGAYGGKPWGNIARCARLYTSVPSNVFVDTVASIRHNGGLAFNKCEAGDFIDMQFDIDGISLSKLLEIKMRARRPVDLFIKLRDSVISRGISHVTYRLLRRFATCGIDPKISGIILDITSNNIDKTNASYLDTLDYRRVEWGTKLLDEPRKVNGRRSYEEDMVNCQQCGKKINIDDIHKYQSKNICEQCINALGLDICVVCSAYVNRGEISKCGCGCKHCPSCHRTCEKCNGNCCAICVYSCSQCGFDGCKHCYRIDHGNECYHCGGLTCEASARIKGNPYGTLK